MWDRKGYPRAEHFRARTTGRNHALRPKLIIARAFSKSIMKPIREQAIEATSQMPTEYFRMKQGVKHIV